MLVMKQGNPLFGVSPRLEELYQSAAADNGDMRLHVPTLRRLASQCKHATEFGVRKGTSTVALLAGVTENGGRLVSYDVRDCRYACKILGGFGNWTFVVGSSLEVSITPTDLLMIDTVHSGWQLEQELNHHAGKVSRYIVLHDTEDYGRVGDDRGRGMWPVIEKFVCPIFRDGESWWRILEHNPECHGLTVLEKVSLEKTS